MLAKTIIIAAAILNAANASALTHYTFIGSGTAEGSYAYFTVTDTRDVGPQRAGIFDKDGAGYSPSIGNYAIGNLVYVLTDRFGQIHPGTGLSIGLDIPIPGSSDLVLYLQPDTLGMYGAGAGFAPFGTYSTFSSFILTPPITGTYSVVVSSLNGTLTISDGAVPEPSVWTMLIVGLGTAGWSIRRRERRHLAR